MPIKLAPLENVNIKNHQIFTDQSAGVNNTSNDRTAFSSGTPIYTRSATDVQNQIRTFTRRNSTGSYIFPQEAIKYFIQMDYAKYSRRSGDALFKVEFNRQGSIFLPLPTTGMTDTHDVDYIESELGVTGAATTAVQDTINELQKQISDIYSSSQENVKEAITAAVSSFGAGSAVTGLAPNKFLTVLLKGPRYKRHELTWKLYPSNFKESTTIAQIINVMNNAMAPGLSPKELLFDFPYVFYMQYKPNPAYLYKFKPAVLESFSTNVVPGGVPAFYGDQLTQKNAGHNAPECVEIRARFLEIEYWLRNQFNFTNDATIDARHRNIDIAKSSIYRSGDLDVATPDATIPEIPNPNLANP